jgi:hypothetical protein
MVGKIVKKRLLVFFCIVSCSLSPKHEPLSENDLKIHEIKAFIRFVGDDHLTNTKPEGIIQLNDSTYSFGYNRRGSFFYLINLDQRKPRLRNYSLPFDLINVEEYGEITSMHLASYSLVSIFQKNRLVIIDLQKPTILFQKNIRITDTSSIAFQDYSIPIHYNLAKNTLYFQLTHMHNLDERDYQFQTEFHGYIDLNDSVLTFIPVTYPKSYGNGELGQNSYMKASIGENKIVYSSTNESWVTVYNLSDGAKKDFSAKSKFHKKYNYNKSLKQDLDLLQERFLLDFKYESIYYDYINGYCYRVYEKEMSQINDSGYFSTIDDKFKGLIILDSSFNYLLDYQIKEQGISLYGPGKRGFYYRTKPFIVNDSIFQKYKVIEFMND